ncbi:hypothetical protein AMEX_G9327 [Astyanax mexicanus]|uniref:Uncharacterized protein n=1 Tax=Astyanax mexicanus TaxID=7994 RepID=A0A8T2LZT1_ASTMX|nr:hypothetical protein AMEX_G9327 [Astyanax mexicanus]
MGCRFNYCCKIRIPGTVCVAIRSTKHTLCRTLFFHATHIESTELHIEWKTEERYSTTTIMDSTAQGHLKWLCLMLVLVSGGAQAQTSSPSCPAWSFEHFSKMLKASEECLQSPEAQWTDRQTAALLDSLRRLTEILDKCQKAVCKDTMPGDCPFPVVHSKGGLACVAIEEKIYCKPMCNEGQDFSFLRRSRVYEECSAATNSKWTTQYVGGNKLAVCNKSNLQISGAASAYFPKDQDCLKTKSDPALEESVIQSFIAELRNNSITGNITHSCLLCG